jgi:hypothetical protein
MSSGLREFDGELRVAIRSDRNRSDGVHVGGDTHPSRRKANEIDVVHYSWAFTASLGSSDDERESPGGSDHGDHNRSTEGTPAETAHCGFVRSCRAGAVNRVVRRTYGAAEHTGAGA